MSDQHQPLHELLSRLTVLENMRSSLIMDVTSLQGKNPVFDRAIDVLGSPTKAARWMISRVPSLGLQVPLTLMTTEEGRRRVEECLGQIEYGVFA